MSWKMVAVAVMLVSFGTVSAFAAGEFQKPEKVEKVEQAEKAENPQKPECPR